MVSLCLGGTCVKSMTLVSTGRYSAAYHNRWTPARRKFRFLTSVTNLASIAVNRSTYLTLQVIIAFCVQVLTSIQRISAQGGDAIAIAEELKSLCVSSGGSTVIPQHIKKDLTTIAKILNINWIERGIQTQARLICSRGAVCPRQPSCYNKCGESDDSGDERQIIEL